MDDPSDPFATQQGNFRPLYPHILIHPSSSMAPQSDDSSTMNKCGSSWTWEEVADPITIWGGIKNQWVLWNWKKGSLWTDYEGNITVTRLVQGQGTEIVVGEKIEQQIYVKCTQYEKISHIFAVSNMVVSKNLLDTTGCRKWSGLQLNYFQRNTALTSQHTILCNHIGNSQFSILARHFPTWTMCSRKPSLRQDRSLKL